MSIDVGLIYSDILHLVNQDLNNIYRN